MYISTNTKIYASNYIYTYMYIYVHMYISLSLCMFAQGGLPKGSERYCAKNKEVYVQHPGALSRKLMSARTSIKRCTISADPPRKFTAAQSVRDSSS